MTQQPTAKRARTNTNLNLYAFGVLSRYQIQRTNHIAQRSAQSAPNAIATKTFPIGIRAMKPTLKETDNMTPELEQWLRKHGTADSDGTYTEDDRGNFSTVAGIGPGRWDKHALANAQGQHGTPADSIARLAADVASRENDTPALFTTKTVYRLYTEDVHRPNDRNDIIKRYFDGATVYWGVGLDARTQDGAEAALIIEIVTSAADALQRIADLAGDLRIAGKQISVLVTRQTVDTFEVTA